MKLIQKTLLAAVLATSSVGLFAQDAGREVPPQRPHRGAPPLVRALDANQDGVLDASEIANAPAALATLDKNGDGQLTADEISPGRPEGGPSGRGPGGPRGPRGQKPQQ